VDLVDVLHTVRKRMRTMAPEVALARVKALRERTTDPVARFALERFARDMSRSDGPPFADPYDWAPFFVSGASRVVVEEVST
jgi:hypothetical protein